MIVGGTVWMLPAEREALLWITGHATPWQDALFIPISLMGEWGACWLLLIAALLLWGDREHKHLGRHFGLALLVVSVCVIVPLRMLFPRERPYQTIPQVEQKGLRLEGRSFPSGHAQSAWLAAFILGRRGRRTAVGLFAFAVLMCYSRVYCGMHYPFDVVAGSLIGILAGTALLILQRGRRAEAMPC
jgi:undecaprenyl-diphosphatase